MHVTDQPADQAIPITPLTKRRIKAWLARQTPERRAWVTASGFAAEAGTLCPLPDGQGGLAGFLFGLDDDPWCWAQLPGKLPPGLYAFAANLTRAEADWAALAWELASYRYARFKSKAPRQAPLLVWPDKAGRAFVQSQAAAHRLVRDLINCPAGDLGPAELAEAARALAREKNATIRVTQGDDLLAANYPMIHAVGRASSRPPCLIDLSWGEKDAPKVTLVGKGVCFDSGGLDLKSSANMKIMKKDMGGAATVLGLALLIIDAGLSLRLRVLVPAVENAVSGNAMRPLDVLKSRKGATVEIGNTDAEGRLILADALTEAQSEQPELLIDLATLTGAARTALGPDLPALFTPDDGLADELLSAGAAVFDPLWRLPLWPGYRKYLDSRIADLNSAPDGPFAGAITAALFLKEFAGRAKSWAHIDLYGWNQAGRPGRPEGGEALAMRALFHLLAARYPARTKSRASRSSSIAAGSPLG